ncbi:UTP--glucose-1-phosphate uridylyltransferase [subsurface metagenome]
MDDPCAFGVVETDSDGRVRRFIEKPDADQVTTHWINAGIYILEPEVLRYVPANEYHMFEKELFPLLLKLGQPVYGYPSSGYWLDMGTPEKYLCLNCDLLSLEAQSTLTGELSKNGICRDKDVDIHSSVRIVGPAVIGSRCRIDQEASIKGPVVIGPGCYLGEGTSIENAILWENVRIGTGARLKQCILGSNTRVDDNARIIRRVLVTDRDGVAHSAEI